MVRHTKLLRLRQFNALYHALQNPLAHDRIFLRTKHSLNRRNQRIPVGFKRAVTNRVIQRSLQSGDQRLHLRQDRSVVKTNFRWRRKETAIWPKRSIGAMSQKIANVAISLTPNRVVQAIPRPTDIIAIRFFLLTQKCPSGAQEELGSAKALAEGIPRSQGLSLLPSRR